MNCLACHAESSTGEPNSEADTVIEVLGLLASDSGVLARMLVGLCDRHRRRVEHIAKAWREGTVEPKASQRKGLDNGQ